MGKRRRERDRPKAPPDSLYNPNKRVHLSYADSDDEDAAAAAANDNLAKRALLLDPRAANPQQRQADEEEGLVEGDSIVEGEVENGDELADEDGEDVPFDDVNSLPDPAHNEDPDIGQSRLKQKRAKKDVRNTAATGCLPIPDDDEDEEEGSDQEVANYMRAVQSQRKVIPHILSAQTLEDKTLYSGDTGEDDVGYEDGAYVSRSRVVDSVPTSESLDPKEVFTKRLLHRFASQRAQLRRSITVDELNTLSDACLISYPAHNRRAKTEWLAHMRSAAPQPTQIRALDEATALRLLGLIEESCLVKSTNLEPTTSAWVWALLCRLDDVGNMYNDDVYPLRQLGKKALYVHLSFAQPDAAAGIDALGEETSGPPDDDAPPEEDQMEQTAHDIATPSSSIMSDNTSATLDMILTIVGEAFGQKDLLQFRQSWNVG